MNKLFYLLTGLLLLSCNQDKDSKSKIVENKNESSYDSEITENFDWLIGNWKQITMDSEPETFENWVKESNIHYSGHGFLMRDSDTLWQEKMMLSFQDSLWILGIQTPGNNDLVEFRLKDIKPASFAAENPIHDFPKSIKYWSNDGQLYALIAGENKEIQFEFKRLE